MTELRLPYAFGNVHQPGTAAARHKTIAMILDAGKGGLAGFNEAGKDDAYIPQAAHARGMSAWAVGENALAWSDHLIVVARFRWLIMVGGHVGADGRAGGDSRRVGPSRFMMLVVLHDPKTGLTFFHATKHDVAKADTSAKWRRAIRKSGWAKVGHYIAGIVDDVPSGILCGDTNTRGVQNLPGVADINIPAPATMGRNHYDKLTRFGTATVLRPRSVNTPSDHNMLVGTFQLTGNSNPIPAVTTNSTGSVVTKIHHATNTPKKKAPKNPRKRYSRRWRRRHPLKWRRIWRAYKKALR